VSVLVAGYDPGWPERFESERARLERAWRSTTTISILAGIELR
jgi:hypothetical protein